MNHIGTKTIETKRLALRRFVSEDAQAMFENWASDPKVAEYVTWPAHDSPAISRMIVDKWVSEYAAPDRYNWAIELKELGQPIGNIDVVQLKDSIEMAHVGYCIGAAWWHKGIMSEALAAVMDFLFDEVGVNRVEARHDSDNPNSGGVMKKCGMKYEGTLRQSLRNKQGRYSDLCCYALLRSER